MYLPVCVDALPEGVLIVTYQQMEPIIVFIM